MVKPALEGDESRMRRVLMVIAAITALIILYPSTHLVAGSPASTNQIHIMTPQDHNATTTDPGNWLFTGEDDDNGGNSKGDTDDLAGFKYGTGTEGYGAFFGGKAHKIKLAVKIWWIYLLSKGHF